MARDVSKLLPKDIPGRIALVLCAIFMAPICGFFGYILLTSHHRRNLGESICLVAAGEILIGLSLFFLCGLVWAICTPKWVEWLTEHIFTHIALAFLVALVPLVGAMIWRVVKGN